MFIRSKVRTPVRCVVALALVALGGGTTATRATEVDEASSFARIAFLRPNEGDTVDFEAGYMRHLAWHRQAGDTWRWFGWTITFGDRQRWFVYATFGHTASDFDRPVAPADDERDNVANVLPHAGFVGNGLYRYLPPLSRGSGIPPAAARLEMTTVEVAAGGNAVFESAEASRQRALARDTLWFRLLAGGRMARYVRLRPAPTIAAIVERSTGDADLAPDAIPHVVSATVELLTLRPTMSLALEPSRDR